MQSWIFLPLNIYLNMELIHQLLMIWKGKRTNVGIPCRQKELIQNPKDAKILSIIRWLNSKSEVAIELEICLNSIW